MTSMSSESSARTSEAMTSEMTSEMSESGGAATTVGGDVTELDAQSVTWFSTFCGGFGGLADLQAQAPNLSSPQAAGQFFSTVGQAMTETGQKLSSVPPPTFEGGDQLASTAQQVFDQLGPAFTEFGQKAATVDANDQAALQQFGADLQKTASGLQDIQKIELSPDVKAAVEKQVPECAVLSQMGSQASGSAAPTS